METTKRRSVLCSFCRARMRGRRGERLESLWERATRTGWKRTWIGVDLRTACQVCAPKVGA